MTTVGLAFALVLEVASTHGKERSSPLNFHPASIPVDSRGPRPHSEDGRAEMARDPARISGAFTPAPR